MTVTLIVIVIMLGAFLAWVVSQSFNVMPWVAGAPTAEMPDRLPRFFTAPRVGIMVFLAAITSLFALCISAYAGRMHLAQDWVSVPAPGMLWLNTLLLVLASVFLHRGWHAAKADNPGGLRLGVVAGGLFALAFIVGQYLAWQQLQAAGHYLTPNPAASFFYLLTALHAVHLIGGLVALLITFSRLWRGQSPAQVRTSMELCTVYWHYLLVLWAVLFGLILFT